MGSHTCIDLQDGPDGIQGVSENTDTFLSLPALVFITPQTSLGARFDP